MKNFVSLLSLSYWSLSYLGQGLDVPTEGWDL